MSELVTTYVLGENAGVAWPMERDQFYSEQYKTFKETGKSSKAVAVVQILLFNEHGEIFIQKRSNDKAHNPGLLDKSIGGHISAGDSAPYTVMVETVQELQVPSIVLPTTEEFIKAHKLMQRYLSTVALIKYVDSQTGPFIKVIKNEKIEIFNKYYLYFGIYSGSIKTVDRESKGTLQYSLEDLEKEIEKFPDTFTYDLAYFIRTYKDKIKEFIALTSRNR